MELADGRVLGSQAIVRWDHPVRVAVPPSTFVPLAERCGSIVEIGRWVLTEACHQAASWRSDLHVAVDVSAAQFRSPRFLADVTAALSSSTLPPRRLVVELNESALAENGRQTARTLNDLRALGVRIALEGFGLGHSSLTHLRELPVDEIKIDRSFVTSASHDRYAMAVMRAIAQVGRDLDIVTVAEGVENAEQLELARIVGCHSVQGLLIGAPAALGAAFASQPAGMRAA